LPIRFHFLEPNSITIISFIMNSRENPSNFSHDRPHVRLLQHAHADHIESMYRSMLALPQNPAQVLIQQIGPVRTFIAAGDRLENRAIFSGEESLQQIDQVLDHFAHHASNCVIEVNPANYYVYPPKNWQQRLLPHLLHRNCRIDGFRCVWHRSLSPHQNDPSPKHHWQHFGPDTFTDFERLTKILDPEKQWTPEDRAAQSHPALAHYIAFEAAQPIATASLFITGTIAYLQWSWTHPQFRSRGLQQEAIQIRLQTAFSQGCTLAFTVTDFNFTSPRNLQRQGFQLAYNYLLVRRDRLST
jgi:GNAT superfamily N-acetyltransferase